MEARDPDGEVPRGTTARRARGWHAAFPCAVALALTCAVPGAGGAANAATPETPLAADAPDAGDDVAAPCETAGDPTGAPRRSHPAARSSQRAPGPHSRVNLAPRSPPPH